MSRFRTLIRVTAVYHDEVKVLIPGWDTQQTVAVPKEEIPFPVEEGRRLHAVVNLDAFGPRDVVFSDWEES